MATVHQIPHPGEAPLIERPAVAQQPIDFEELMADSDEDMHESDFSPAETQDGPQWHSIAVFDTEAHSARGRVPFAPYAAFFRRVRALIGLRHHDVAAILQISPTPDDLFQLSTTPALILRHDDLAEGDFRRVALVDIEYHRSSYLTSVETDRVVLKLPDLIHRSNFLHWIRVDRFCSASQDRCLVWHNGQLVPRQSHQLMQIHHGDYIRVAVPPHRDEELPTRFAVRCLQAGLSDRQIIRRYHVRGEDTDSLYSEVSAAQPDEEVSLMQRGATTLQSSSSHSPIEGGGQGLLPHWYSDLTEALSARASVECEEEGPVGYVETWYLQREGPYVTEESRAYRVTQDSYFWERDLYELWHDRIDRSRFVHFLWVRPTPASTATRHRLGHLLVVQRPVRDLAPVLLTIEFHSESSLHVGFAAALVQLPVSVNAVVALARLQRNCALRHCNLRFGGIQWGPHEERDVPPGAGLVLSVLPSSRQCHLADGHQVAP